MTSQAVGDRRSLVSRVSAYETMESRMQPLIGARRGVIKLGNLVLNRDTFHVSVASEPAFLGKYEFDLLEALALQPGLIIHSDDLCQLLWGEANRLCRRRLSVMVFRLRSKLTGLGPYRIESARSRGYGLVLGEESAILDKGAFSGGDTSRRHPAGRS